MNIIVIPVYNDWKSINHLLSKINRMLKFGNLVKILIINDCSTQKVNINKKNIKNIKEIKILSLKKNVGSQKSIAIGLNYLKKLKKDFYITVMDGDGEDNPLEIKKMLSKAKKNLNFIITSHRKKRNENFIIKFGYKIHLIISFLLTWNWISFGNFSCFHSSNLKKLLVNNNIWYAYSAGVIKNCKIKKLYATRQKRYFETSKVNFFKLIEHSLRIMGVFYQRVLISSFFFIYLISILFSQFDLILYTLIILMNLIVLAVKVKNYLRLPLNYKDFLKNLKKI